MKNSLLRILKECLERLIENGQSSFCVAVSGGADSLALVLAVHQLSKTLSFQFSAVTVDHKLREQSTLEADKVHAWLSNYGIDHTILTWDHDVLPTSGIQEKAREARYSLMATYCKERKIPYLLTAHHLNDQLETFFMRLNNGSGLKGLCVMNEKTVLDEALYLIRPFLTLPATCLKQYLYDYFPKQPYLQDPSNEDERFERVQWRQALSHLPLDLEMFLKTLNKLKATQQWIEDEIDDHYEQIVSFSDASATVDIRLLLQCHHELATRILQKALQDFSPKPYPPASQRIHFILHDLHDGFFTGRSLYGCVIQQKKGQLIIRYDSRCENTHE